MAYWVWIFLRCWAPSCSSPKALSRYPSEPLLYVPMHPARTLDADLVRAGMPKEAVGGKLDFHAVRLAYIRAVCRTVSGIAVIGLSMSSTALCLYRTCEGKPL